jgi:Cft2 family RNA processing exonuclease
VLISHFAGNHIFKQHKQMQVFETTTTMAICDALTGKRCHLPHCKLQLKKCQSHALAEAGRMCSKHAVFETVHESISNQPDCVDAFAVK